RGRARRRRLSRGRDRRRRSKLTTDCARHEGGNAPRASDQRELANEREDDVTELKAARIERLSTSRSTTRPGLDERKRRCARAQRRRRLARALGCFNTEYERGADR